VCLEAAEELSLDSPVTKESDDVNHQKEDGPKDDVPKEGVLNHDVSKDDVPKNDVPKDDVTKDNVPSGALAEPIDNHSHDLSSEPPKLSVSESAASPAIPKSQSVPEVTPSAKSRSGAKVDRTCFQCRMPQIVLSMNTCLRVLPMLTYTSTCVQCMK